MITYQYRNWLEKQSWTKTYRKQRQRILEEEAAEKKTLDEYCEYIEGFSPQQGESLRFLSSTYEDTPI